MTTDVDDSFARIAGGKRTCKVEARVTDELKFDLQRRCHDIGMSESDYVMRLLAVTLYGADHVNSIEQARTRAVCGMSALIPDSVPVQEPGLRVAA